MGVLFMALGGVCYLAAFICGLIVLIDAFKNEWWKGLLYLLCGFYALYYMFVEFQNEKKWQIVAGCFLGSIVGMLFMFLGSSAMHGH